MGKSKAEIQKAYRERKKLQEGEAYLKRERERVKGYYVPVDEIPHKKAKERRKKVREWVRQHRLKKKSETNLVATNMTNENENQSEEVSSSTDVTSTTGSQPLIIKLPSIATKKRTRTRMNRANAKHRRTIEELKKQNEILNRKVKTVSKRYERFVKSANKTKSNTTMGNIPSSTETTPSTSTLLTPRKRTMTEIREEGLTPRKIPKRIQERLLFENVITEELGVAWRSNGIKGKKVLKNLVNGEIIRKYKMKKLLGAKTGIRRHHFVPRCGSKKLHSFPRIQKRVESREKLRQDVTKFLERDDNSRLMPEKKDYKKTETGKKQKRILNDSMMYLHLKFKTESPAKISLATFCRLRPKYICLTKHLSRNTCLCQKHQNMALILKNMKASGANVKINPDEFIRQLEDTSLPDILSELKDENVKYEQWKKVDMPDGKKRTRIIEKKVTRENFIAIAYAQVQDFKEHVSRVQLQYVALNNLKQNLPVGHAIIQMDFAENFSCCSKDEVQGCYWNPTPVTLHPVVLYFKGETGQLEHKNYVFISDDLGHNFRTVYAILQRLIVEVKSHVKDLEVVHYWTDSPSSQYRNKTAFFVVSDHKSLFGCEAIWNFFESGHGKGPCDGIGGTSKRTADLAIRQGKITVQDAHEYFERVQRYHKSAQYIFISSAECTESRSKLSEVNKLINPVKGTMQVHCVVGVSKGIIKTSITSCYCQDCLGGCFHEYSVANLMKSARQNDAMDKETVDTPRTETEEITLEQDHADEIIEIINVDIGKDVFVAAIYDKAWHVGKITDTDEEDGECEVTFMRPSTAKGTGKTTYKWPNPEDKIWLHVTDILCNIREPTKMGHSGRSFEIHPDDTETARGLLEDRLKS